MEEHKSQKMLWIVLSFLCVAIVGLVVGIVVVGIKSEEAIIYDEDEIVNSLLIDIIPMSDEEADSYLIQQSEKYNDPNIRFDIKIMRMNVFINGGQPESAILVASEINEDNLDEYQRMDFYAALIKSYEQIGDDEIAQNYIKKYNTIYNGLYNGGVGGD